MSWKRYLLRTRALAFVLTLAMVIGLVPAPGLAEMIEGPAADPATTTSEAEEKQSEEEGQSEEETVEEVQDDKESAEAANAKNAPEAEDSEEAITDVPADDEDKQGGQDKQGDAKADVEEVPGTLPQEEPVASIVEEKPTAYPAFEPVAVKIDGVSVTVRAPEGVFPEGAALSVRKVPARDQESANAAVDEARDEDANVAASYTFDIKVVNPLAGEEYQPADGQSVEVSFALAEAADQNLDADVYHIAGEGAGMTAEKLNADVDAYTETITATTDGFSLYTVEFTYNNLEYVMQGDATVALSEILQKVGLTGEVAAVDVSNASLFSASNETGEWLVTAHQAFLTTEWMKVTINDVTYEITVTDDMQINS